MTVIEQSFNIFFFADILVNFFTAYTDQDFQVIDDYKVFQIFQTLILVNCKELSHRLVLNRLSVNSTFRPHI